MRAFILSSILLVASFIFACSDDDCPVNSCVPTGAEVILFMQNDPHCFDVHADIQFTVKDGNKEYVLLELLFDRGPPYNTPFSEVMSFGCGDSLEIDFWCYSDEYWEDLYGTVKIPITCHEFNYIGVYADTINPLSLFRDYDGYVALVVDEPYKCEEVDSLYFAWGSVSEDK